jgi:hypothetical protein
MRPWIIVGVTIVAAVTNATAQSDRRDRLRPWSATTHRSNWRCRWFLLA